MYLSIYFHDLPVLGTVYLELVLKPRGTVYTDKLCRGNEAEQLRATPETRA